MSHHFDTPTGREDPRLNFGDLYLFEGGEGRTVMAMTSNPGVAPATSNPEAYAERVLARLGPLTLPYKLDSTAAFDYVGFNGRALGDDVMDVVLSLMTNSALGDGVAPDPALIRDEFPYFTQLS